MAQTGPFPPELWDMIADKVQAYKDLKNLSLTCRTLRTSAQEALHRNVRIGVSSYNMRYSYDGDDDNYDNNDWSRLGCLIRTLLERPDLTSSVRSLMVSITKKTMGLKRPPTWGCYCNCDRDNSKRLTEGKGELHKGFCVRGWDYITFLCEAFLETASSSTGLDLSDPRCMQMILDGEQLAVLGIILMCTPKPQELSILRFLGRRVMEVCDGVYESDLKPKHIELDEMFGDLVSTDGFLMSCIPGLANLRSLSANCLLPSALVTLRKVTGLGFGLQNRQFDELPNGIELPAPTDAATASTLKEMRITLDLDCLRNNAEPQVDDVYHYAQQLPQLLPNLHHLNLVVEPVLRSSEWFQKFGGGSFQMLVNKFEGDNIETLIIDTSNIQDEKIEIYDDDFYRSSGTMRWAQQLNAIESLARFPKLRKIVAAQEAFFSVDEHFQVCELPCSIEEIGMIDTTCAIDRWMKHMLDNKWKYPNLKLITFWGKYLYWEPNQHIQDWDPRLGNEDAFPWDDYEVDDENAGTQKSGGAPDGDGGSEGDGPREANQLEDEYEETESIWSRDLPEPWKQEFALATRHQACETWDGLEAAGVELREKYWHYGRPWHALWTAF